MCYIFLDFLNILTVFYLGTIHSFRNMVKNFAEKLSAVLSVFSAENLAFKNSPDISDTIFDQNVDF